MFLRLMALILSAILAAGQSVPVAAEEDADAVLRRRGYPETVISYMDERGKAELASKPGYRFSDYKLLWYDNGEAVRSDRANMPEKPGLVTLWVASVRTLPGGTPESVFVQMSYEWNPLPLIRGRDALTAQWDADTLRVKDGSFYKIDSYDGTLLDDNGKVVTSYTDITREKGTVFETKDGEIDWTAKLGGLTGLVMTGLRGYARFTLVPSADAHDNTAIACGYRHRTLFGGSVSPDCTLSVKWG